VHRTARLDDFFPGHLGGATLQLTKRACFERRESHGHPIGRAQLHHRIAELRGGRRERHATRLGGARYNAKLAQLGGKQAFGARSNSGPAIEDLRQRHGGT
jgi:hypothetical protein